MESLRCWHVASPASSMYLRGHKLLLLHCFVDCVIREVASPFAVSNPHSELRSLHAIEPNLRGGRLLNPQGYLMSRCASCPLPPSLSLSLSLPPSLSISLSLYLSLSLSLPPPLALSLSYIYIYIYMRAVVLLSGPS